MNKTLLALVALSLLAVLPINACDELGLSGIVEDNDLWISAAQKSGLNGVSEEDFNAILDRVETLYKPIIEEKGGNLIVTRNWESGTVNAYARRVGKNWEISMFGGLARHETITADAFALVACHELGHHIGGAPKKTSWWGGAYWASNEGQSDYWGSMKCLRRYMEKDNNEEIVAQMSDVDEFAKTKCEELYSSNANELAMCIRGAMAGLSLGNLFRALRRMETKLSFTTPDTRVVPRTNHNHPAPQCRLDTYFAGSICDKSYDQEVSQTDPDQGVCNRAESAENGLRPLCWFLPPNSDEA